MICVKLVTEDIIYVDHDFAKFSLVPLDGFRNWSSYMAKEFKGYTLND
jgi:predicted glycosyltransferase involved in capsule biosynthesis